jgi:hypothetical protein
MKPLFSKQGAVLGYLKTVSQYRKEILSRSGAVLGYYNPKLNQTFTAKNGLYGHGDLRASLLNNSR